MQGHTDAAIDLKIDWHRKVFEDVERDVIRKAYTRMIYDKIRKGQEVSSAVDLVREDIGDEYFVKPSKQLEKKWFITISAKDGVDFCAFWRQMHKCVKKKNLSGHGFYWLEQRSEGTQEPYGWHIHWRVEFDTEKHKAKYAQEIFQCFARFLGHKEAVHLAPWNDNQLKYAEGDKVEEKLPKVFKDRLLREKYNIPHKVIY